MGFCGIGLCNSGLDLDSLDSFYLNWTQTTFFPSPHSNNTFNTTTLRRRRSISTTSYSYSYSNSCFGRQWNHLISIRCSTVSSHSHSHSHSEDEVINVAEEEQDDNDDLDHVQAGGPVIKFNISDFVICDRVSIGLGGRGDELVFEAMVKNPQRCVGFMMAKMVLRELMDPLIFSKFKSFLTKGNDPSCFREFLMPVLSSNISSGNSGLQNWGAGWNLLSLLLVINPYERINCLDALRHPFLCGPRWRVVPSMEIIRWGLGSTAIKIIEEYIYGKPQRSRLAHFIELMEMLNPYPKPKNWLKLLPGRWRLLYCTGRHIGLTFLQPSTRVLIGDVHLNTARLSTMNTTLLCNSDINFQVMIGLNWPHEKTGVSGKLKVNSLFKLTAGRRLYLTGEVPGGKQTLASQDSYAQKSSRKWKKGSPMKEPPSSLPVAKLASGEIDVMMSLDDASLQKVNIAENILQEVRKQIP